MRLQVELDRVALGEGPTPVRELTRLGEQRGRAPIWIKDDGAYSVAGGNKARKLEWLLADARRRGKRTILTTGALGTNHGLACALFAPSFGMRVVLVLVPQPLDDHVRRQLQRMREAGAEIHFAAGKASAAAQVALLMLGRATPVFNLPYLLPPGGSTPLGCLGYVEAGLELGEQISSGALPEPSHVVVALGTGGTAAGLLLGLRLAALRSRLVCVLVQDISRVDASSVARLARRTRHLLERQGGRARAELSEHDLDVERGWLGHGYGHLTPQGQQAIELLGEREGVQLDPVYTAKAMAATLELNRLGAFGDGPVLYWHTYDRPS